MNLYNPTENSFHWELLKDIPEIMKLKEIPQNETWHKEGDVFTHTCMVVQSTLDHISNGTFEYLDSPVYREVLVYSALLHDVGKCSTTVKGEDGLHHSPDHAIKSAEMAVDLLVKLKVDEYLHKAIISLVRWHMQPMYIANNTNPDKAILKLTNSLDQINADILILLKQCDCEGAIYDEDDKYSEKLSNVRNLYYGKVTYAKGTKVKITKLGDNDTCSYTPGHHPNGINTGYETEGILIEPITKGHRVSFGFNRFSSSPVTEIVSKNCFKTKNSVYQITEK